MSDQRPAKPVGNLALRVVDRYHYQLCIALSSDPHQMAHKMYGENLISRECLSRAVDTHGSAPLDKAWVLLNAIGAKIASDTSSETLKAFCSLLEGYPEAGSIAARMKATLAYVERHHQLPAIEWSSDTECEQIPLSPGQHDQPRLENLPPAMKRHSCYLKELYKEREGIQLKWPRVTVKDFVNLYFINKEKKVDEQKLTEELVRGNIRKVQKQRMPVALSDLARMKDGSRPQCILVQGAPGSGKTMFSWEVSQKWAQGELLQQYPLVVMLPLRDPDIQSASSIEDLFSHDHKPFQRAVAAAVEQEAGKGVLLLIEGFDELPDGKRTASSLWMKLITGKLLPLATVMVTSRPWATKTLLEPGHSCRVSQHFEIVGFTKENINQYISKAFENAEEESEFHVYLATYPHIHSLMYIPLNCAIVVEVYRSAGSTYPASKTMTQLYTALVKELILRCLKSKPKGSSKSILTRILDKLHFQSRIGGFDCFHYNVYEHLCSISSKAYKGLCNKQQLIFSDLPPDFETLDLLQRVPQFYDTRNNSVSYNFLHLTVQEFLAAFHILQCRQREKKKIMIREVAREHLTIEKAEGSSDTTTNHVDDTDASNSGEDERGDELRRSSEDVVRMFVAGLSGHDENKISLPECIKQKHMAVLHLLFECQNEHLTTILLGNEAIVRVVNTSSARPDDMYMLGYCISLSSCQWELNLLNMDDEHMGMLKKAITNWGHGNGRIMKARFRFNLTSHGLHQLLSLPQRILSGLSELDLSFNNLDSKSSEMLAHNLLSLPHLEILCLRRNQIDAGDYIPLIKAISTTASLQEVSFDKLSPEECRMLMSQECVSRVYLENLSEDSVEAMAAALNDHHSLAKLKISSSNFSHQNMSIFTSSLKTNRTLQVLHLVDANIDCKCAELLSQSLHSNTTLTELDLSHNGIKDRGGCSLAKALRVNKNLEVLTLCYNQLGRESVEQLMECLEHFMLKVLNLAYLTSIYKSSV